jgi:hypothetical protein
MEFRFSITSHFVSEYSGERVRIELIAVSLVELVLELNPMQTESV